MLKKKKLEDHAKVRHSLYNKVFGSVNGKKVLYDLMEHCHFTNTNFVASNPHEVIFREGERNVLLKILHHMNYSPDKISKLLHEKRMMEDDNV